MAAEMALIKPVSKFSSRIGNPRIPVRTRFSTVRMSSTAAPPPASANKPKKSQKQEIKETLLTPRFYTTDFDEMEELFNTQINKNLNMDEFEALLQEFKTDFNQTHFVRNKEFKEAADKINGPLRQILWSSWRGLALLSSLVFFSIRSLEGGSRENLILFVGFECLMKTNPVVAEIFSLMSRDEARHAGHLKENPEYQCYPIFKYFENWCQDENRHGDFFSALMKAQPQFLNDWKAKLWARFFCLSVYVTMYLNDCQRTAFYEGIGLDTKEFDMHVIIETNRTTARIFPAVLDVENPEFKRKLDRMVEINEKLLAVGETDDIPLVKNLKRIPLIAALASELLAAYLMKPIESGSVDFADFEPRLVY
ncbi:Magnesium-protoporphyrin IX monomethyl ester [oxidative] cyclase, chloroplastic [Sesamum angolense]|uniref:Magnesium-protoporphyrin IX monomethyl ester [oxidative] cyclase, chloroplastic n=1 Tax=Sesamum angolense TaxID=2727404 RepID=A0AAE2BP79_9LAMI|nr:Magnesium-protoporphyrin IX monomethyl ester [oxidative] cyclase, chloroplastic [Sesamum angolense]